jgi:propionyl-CoA carboxylase beta chain
MTGPAAEREGSLKHGLAAMYAMAWAEVPVFAVIIRKAFGFGGALMGGYEGGQTLGVTWPTVDFSSLPRKVPCRARTPGCWMRRAIRMR